MNKRHDLYHPEHIMYSSHISQSLNDIPLGHVHQNISNKLPNFYTKLHSDQFVDTCSIGGPQGKLIEKSFYASGVGHISILRTKYQLSSP